MFMSVYVYACISMCMFVASSKLYMEKWKNKSNRKYIFYLLNNLI